MKMNALALHADVVTKNDWTDRSWKQSVTAPTWHSAAQYYGNLAGNQKNSVADGWKGGAKNDRRWWQRRVGPKFHSNARPKSYIAASKDTFQRSIRSDPPFAVVRACWSYTMTVTAEVVYSTLSEFHSVIFYCAFWLVFCRPGHQWRHGRFANVYIVTETNIRHMHVSYTGYPEEGGFVGLNPLPLIDLRNFF